MQGHVREYKDKRNETSKAPSLTHILLRVNKTIITPRTFSIKNMEVNQVKYRKMSTKFLSCKWQPKCFRQVELPKVLKPLYSLHVIHTIMDMCMALTKIWHETIDVCGLNDHHRIRLQNWCFDVHHLLLLVLHQQRVGLSSKHHYFSMLVIWLQSTHLKSNVSVSLLHPWSSIVSFYSVFLTLRL